jgi:hypothetical protein
MVETEFGTMNRQCLDRRIPDSGTLASELDRGQKRRNVERATIHWRCSLNDAREKSAGSYPVAPPRSPAPERRHRERTRGMGRHRPISFSQPVRNEATGRNPCASY